MYGTSFFVVPTTPVLAQQCAQTTTAFVVPVVQMTMRPPRRPMLVMQSWVPVFQLHQSHLSRSSNESALISSESVPWSDPPPRWHPCGSKVEALKGHTTSHLGMPIPRTRDTDDDPISECGRFRVVVRDRKRSLPGHPNSHYVDVPFTCGSHVKSHVKQRETENRASGAQLSTAAILSLLLRDINARYLLQWPLSLVTSLEEFAGAAEEAWAPGTAFHFRSGILCLRSSLALGLDRRGAFWRGYSFSLAPSAKGPLACGGALAMHSGMDPSLFLAGTFVGCHILLQFSRYKGIPHRAFKPALLYTPTPPNPPSDLVLTLNLKVAGSIRRKACGVNSSYINSSNTTQLVVTPFGHCLIPSFNRGAQEAEDIHSINAQTPVVD
ncbi:hypothetical protein DFH94DRAFT_680340 [Russula ochroleuca]|uniref:Uncharacterized protein n=1 Tax=Russula ochroleuca TaxID=152965 RepID=A0A9P5TCB9_9AGAM|nr:hypothetical protein DFH94DRAFT_680340 [Russula ochroleuca]